MAELVIAEKPSAALKIAQSFGKYSKKVLHGVAYYKVPSENITIASAVGHLFGLKKVERLYPTFNLEWKPTYETSKSSAFTKKYFMTLKSLGKRAKEYTIATDYDIEGEVIGLNIIRELFKKKDASRMKFSTLMPAELQRAYKEKSKSINWPQARAGIVRHNIDWFYGINLSYIVGSAVSKALNRYQPISIGRVQGPTLAILAERELEIQKFKPENFWQIFANLWLNSQKVQAVHERDKFWKKEEAEEIFYKVRNKDGAITDIKKAKQKVNVPFPFDLTSLQIEAYRVFRYPPAMTLRLAQSLYSNAYISYPRTSSQKLPFSLGLKVIVEKLAKQKNYTSIASQILRGNLKPNEGPKSDSAHPSIYPTGELPTKLIPQEAKLYDLIVKRFLSVFGEPGERESTRVNMSIQGETFLFSGIVTTKAGWQVIYAPYSKRKEVELPVLRIGQVLKQSTEFAEKETQPPPRYTHASLIKKLEKEGLGTKATRSSIIETLEKRNYTQGSPIAVTQFGMKIYDTFRKNAHEILSVELTRHLEAEMQKVFDGNMTPEKVLKDAELNVRKLYTQLKSNSDVIGASLSEEFEKTRKKQAELIPCPKCKKGMFVSRVSKKSRKRFMACNRYPDCKITWPLPQKGVITVTKKTCEDCGNIKLQAKSAKKPWLFCPNPDCKSKEE